MNRATDLGSVSTRIRRIAELARQMPELAMTSLNHYIDIHWLGEAYRRTRKDGAVGIDGETAAEFASDLESRLADLLERFKSGRYRAPAVRRVHIPKGDGTKTRAIGVPAFEDKVLQRAVVMVLESVYEEDFFDFSYGCRPGRNAHGALEFLRNGLMEMSGGWVVEADIKGFFDALVPRHLREMLDRRVRDGVIRRAIDKWLKAGVLEEGQRLQPETGTPQGGVVSPLLANIYLHEVLDRWFEDDVKPRLRGPAFLVRYVDDFVMVFAQESDARRVFEVLPKRLARFGLELHPEKSGVVDFCRPRFTAGRDGRVFERPGTFDFLGFTHYWARSRRGYWVIKQKTSKARLARALRSVDDWCRRHRHDRVRDQHQALVQKLKGHESYFGLLSNGQALSSFRQGVLRSWRRWLDRRSHSGHMWWYRFLRLLKHYPLPLLWPIHATYRPTGANDTI